MMFFNIKKIGFRSGDAFRGPGSRLLVVSSCGVSRLGPFPQDKKGYDSIHIARGKCPVFSRTRPLTPTNFQKYSILICYIYTYSFKNSFMSKPLNLLQKHNLYKNLFLICGGGNIQLSLFPNHLYRFFAT
jgi:hypothetical protein